MEPQLRLVNNPSKSRYELSVDGTLAGIAEYEENNGTINYVHTEVLPGNEGKGLGSKLAKGALDEAKSRGLKVEATCPFIQGYMQKHPGYA